MLMRDVNWLGSATEVRGYGNWYRRQIPGRFFPEQLAKRHFVIIFADMGTGIGAKFKKWLKGHLPDSNVGTAEGTHRQ